MALVPYKKPSTSAYRSGFEDFDRIFDNLFRNALTNISAPLVSDLAVRMDVSETDKAYVIEAEIPGIDEKDIDLTIKDGLLTIAGERQSEEETEGKTFHRIERSYGSFRRSLQLPTDADDSKVEAHMKNGVLEIEVAKVKEAHQAPKRINIRKS